MSRVANICKSSKQRGNALVLLLLLKTWDGSEDPTRDELAELANISPRQAERDLQKLIDEGDAERVPDEVRGRGHVTRFRLKETTSHVSDKTMSDVTHFIPEEVTTPHPSDLSGSTSDASYLSDGKPVTSDVDTTRNHDTSDGTPVAPYSDIRTSTDTPQPTVEGDADAPPPPPKKVKKVAPPKAEGPMSRLADPEREVLEAWRSLTKSYPPEYAWPTIFERILDGFDAARFKRCGGAYLTHIGRGQRYVGGILDWYERNQTTPEKVTHAEFGAHRNGNSTRKPGLAERAREAAEYFRPRGKTGGVG